jgi:hypothetical protein
MATYGTKGPLLVRRGDGTLHKEQKSVGQHGRDHTGNFTQVWAAARRKTLLLLWWIDGGKMVVAAARLPGRVASGRNGYVRMNCEGGGFANPGSNPFSGYLGPPFID